MNWLLTACAILIAASFASGCSFSAAGVQGSGTSATETRQVEPFSSISLRGVGQINIKIGAERSLAITADDNILPLLVTDVRSNELIISPKQSISPRTKIRIDVVMPELSNASISGSGDVRVSGLEQQAVSFAISGSGDVSAAGSVQSLDCRIRGSGSMDLKDLAARNATVSISGSGDATINATEKLEVSISGSGDVRYVGKPAQVQKSIAGSGSVRPAS